MPARPSLPAAPFSSSFGTLAFGSLLSLALGGCTSAADDSAKDGTPSDPPYVVINEAMAENVTLVQDEAGEFDDWIELYNPGDTAAVLTDTWLSDDENAPTMWAFPDGTTVEPQGFLVVWCDDGTGTDGLHATFKLDKAGDQILVYYVHGADQPLRLDWVKFGPQDADTSVARVPDGSANLVDHAAPTPGTSNGC